MQNIFKPRIICCRWAPSLGELEATHQEVWGTTDYNYKAHKDEPTVFFGLYDLRDYIALWRHKGKAWILWAGSDLENLISGFAFNDGKLKWLSKIFRGFFTAWVLKQINKAENFVEDKDEYDKLNILFDIKPKIVPSFLGMYERYTTPRKEYKHNFNPHVYVSLSQNREQEYGLNTILRIAPLLPKHTFHIYGSDNWHDYKTFFLSGMESTLSTTEAFISSTMVDSYPIDPLNDPRIIRILPNVMWHGKVPKEQFNREIAQFQCGLRLNTHDGFSEITAKSILMAQYAITRLEYPMIPNFRNDDELISLLDDLRGIMVPTKAAQTYYRQALNRYPWNTK